MLSASPTVTAGLRQARDALDRAQRGNASEHLLKAMHELDRALQALPGSDLLRQRWARLAIQFCGHCGLADHPRDAGEAITALWRDVARQELAHGSIQRYNQNHASGSIRFAAR